MGKLLAKARLAPFFIVLGALLGACSHVPQNTPPLAQAQVKKIPPRAPRDMASLIISRKEWGADESWRAMRPECPLFPETATQVRFAVVHDTEDTNDYSREEAPGLVRGIYHMHTHKRGWCDIGYNFLIDRYGRIYEGRYGGIRQAVVGAHAQGFNKESVGVAIIGNFHTEAPPKPALDALARLLAWKFSSNGVNPQKTILVQSAGGKRYPKGALVWLSAISGHLDVGDTDCPGEDLYALLPLLRTRTLALMTPPSAPVLRASLSRPEPLADAAPPQIAPQKESPPKRADW